MVEPQDGALRASFNMHGSCLGISALLPSEAAGFAPEISCNVNWEARVASWWAVR